MPISFGRSPTAEKMTVDDAALLLIARAAEGSMRDAQSALDQVMAFAGQKITSDDVATVLGLVGRDLVLDMVTAVADETPAARLRARRDARSSLATTCDRSCASSPRVVRDLLVLVGRSRRASTIRRSPRKSERDRMKALSQRFSREDLLRSFDVLAKAEIDIRTAVAAAVSPRDGAAAMDSPAQAGAADGAARRDAARRRRRPQGPTLRRRASRSSEPAAI